MMEHLEWSDIKVSEAVKVYMRHLVSETNQYPSIFKYCNFDGAVKMLSAQNIQFTRADNLNDEDEVNISKCDIRPQIKILRECHIPESVIEAKFEDTKRFFNGVGICSCGKTPNNETLWNRYTKENITDPEDGLCIELNQKMVIDHLISNGFKVIALLVKYFDNVNNFLPWELFLGNQFEKSIFFQLLYTSKQRAKWEDEDEIRLIYSEPFSGIHFRPSLNPKCFKTVYYGKDMTLQQRMKIGQILNRYPNIRRDFRK